MTKAESKGDNVFERLIAKAVEVHADGLEIEYKDGQEEVCAMRGNIGVGIASLDSSSEETRALRQHIYKLRKKGASITVQGKTYRLKVSVYDSFGEEAYRIDIGSPNNTPDDIRRPADGSPKPTV